jgi:hypothetical protein
MLHLAIGLCCVGAACLVGAATESKSHRKVANAAQARRKANGFKSAKVGACSSCSGVQVGNPYDGMASVGNAFNGSARSSAAMSTGADAFEFDLPWLPDDIAVIATDAFEQGLRGDDLLLATLNTVYPQTNYFDPIEWPVRRSSPLALLQEKTRRHINSLRLGR